MGAYSDFCKISIPGKGDWNFSKYTHIYLASLDFFHDAWPHCVQNPWTPEHPSF